MIQGVEMEFEFTHKGLLLEQVEVGEVYVSDVVFGRDQQRTSLLQEVVA